MIVDLSDFRLEKAKALGFEICNSSRENLRKKAISIFGSAASLSKEAPNVDIYIDASGAPAILDEFMEIGKIECRIVVVGVHMAKQYVDMLHLTYAQQAIIGSGGYKQEDVCDVMNMMESGSYNIDSIITHEFSLGDIVKAIETAGNTDESLNVIIKF
ncbi:MAG: zinc-binding dehydrogenase [Oscillospiraceae bacterium]|nr:zinc-binding dehydrogenase [Oscillospiraceae bacterium]